ncbi:MAG: alpha/beta fold hydrolase [Vulcanimicrobiaceae bacterium]
MIDNPYYSQEIHGPFEVARIGDFALEEGGTIPDCKLAYATFGRLDSAKDNAILVTTWYSGTSKIMEQVYIGRGRALDPDKYFIVVIDQIGDGLSSSPHNTPAPYGMSKFPKVRIGDDVRAQHKLLTEKFGISELALVTGGSMGAQQTYEWAVRYPEMVKRAAPIAGTAKNTEHDFLWTSTLNEAIRSDPNWNGGEYRSHADVVDGLKRQAHLWMVMGWSTEFYKRELYKTLGFPDLEAFTTGFMEPYFTAMDPNDLLCLAWKWMHGDVSRHTGGDLAAALGKITAKTFVIPIDEDMFFPPRDCIAEQKLIRGSELRVIESFGGHLALFGVEDAFKAQVDAILSELLAVEVPAKHAPEIART